MKTNRRDFLKSSLALGTVAMTGTMGLSSCAKKEPKPFGFQVWTIREKIVSDLAGTCKMMAGLGYKQVEMCSPLGYSDAGFEPLNKLTGAEMRTIINDAGLDCVSSHFNFGELRENLDDRIEWALGIGLKQMVLSSFWLPADTATIDDYRRSADELNGIAEKTRAAGLPMGFHNHHMEFQKRGDELIYDALLDEFDPELVRMQFQVAVVNIGYKAADYFRQYPGRFISAHLADWSAEQEKQVPIGQGIVDWTDFFQAAEIGGVQNVFVEMDPDTFGPSAEFLSKVMV